MNVPLKGTVVLQKGGLDVGLAAAGDILSFRADLLFGLNAKNPDGTDIWAIQWYRDSSPIIGEKGSSYTVTSNDRGADISVELTSNVQTAIYNLNGSLSSGAISVPAVYRLTVKTDGNGTLLQGSDGDYPAGAIINLEAAPNTGYEFVKWESDKGSFDNAVTKAAVFTMPGENAAVTAVFQQITGGAPGGGGSTPPGGSPGDGGGSTPPGGSPGDGSSTTPPGGSPGDGSTTPPGGSPSGGSTSGGSPSGSGAGSIPSGGSPSGGSSTSTAGSPTGSGAANVTSATGAAVSAGAAVTIPEATETGSAEGSHDAYVSGYPEGTFKPDNDITRAELAMLLYKIYGGTGDKSYTQNPFPDADIKAWYGAATAFSKARGFMTGYPGGSFQPGRLLTRAELSTVLAKITDLQPDNDRTSSFPDIKNHWAEAYITAAQGKGYVTGYPEGTFKPEQNATRAEVVKIMNKLMDRQPDREDPLLNEENTFDDLVKGHWAYEQILEATLTHDFEGKTLEKWTLVKK
jgi:hypothetical protein